MIRRRSDRLVSSLETPLRSYELTSRADSVDCGDWRLETREEEEREWDRSGRWREEAPLHQKVDVGDLPAGNTVRESGVLRLFGQAFSWRRFASLRAPRKLLPCSYLDPFQSADEKLT